MTFSKEFKEAISHLPSKEKDKLLFRLLKKDDVLAERLAFQLLEKKSVEDKRREMQYFIIDKMSVFSQRFYSPGILMMDAREISGYITHHLKITKDKVGEAGLNLIMINQLLELNRENILSHTKGQTKKLCTYIVARTFKILGLIVNMHEDMWLDFQDDLNKMQSMYAKNDHLMATAIHHGLDLNWINAGHIPADIDGIQKKLRLRGYLK